MKSQVLYLRVLVGVDHNVVKVLKGYSGVLGTLNPEMVESNLKLLRNYGIPNEHISTIDEKLGVFRSFGWSDLEIFGIVRKLPMFLTQTATRIRIVVDFFMNELGYSPHYLASHPVFLTLSFDKRVKPRVEVVRTLTKKNLNRRKAGLFSVLSMSESMFLKNYILPYKDVLPVPDMYNAYLSKAEIPKIKE
ncbi:OLC1v1005699C1 [Oldenlandia corymbosa var. corymbosa]|uniref:OLC1v1005699C1 n=1 Tax=Oldenlandia corymbosa var. corymbosa TaxID=529605 RepID=A0AAV1DFA5_OLDCO|nr:OLC1v1005699C1 [Oldenlandia corymbosa var. corymbosa]